MLGQVGFLSKTLITARSLADKGALPVEGGEQALLEVRGVCGDDFGLRKSCNNRVTGM